MVNMLTISGWRHERFSFTMWPARINNLSLAQLVAFPAKKRRTHRLIIVSSPVLPCQYLSTSMLLFGWVGRLRYRSSSALALDSCVGASSVFSAGTGSALLSSWSRLVTHTPSTYLVSLHSLLCSRSPASFLTTWLNELKRIAISRKLLGICRNFQSARWKWLDA